MPAEPANTPDEDLVSNPDEPTRTYLRPVPDTAEPNTEPAAHNDSKHNDEHEHSDPVSEPRPNPLIPAWGWAKETFNPDSGLWSTRPLAPDEVIDRAKNGSQLPATGPLRTVSIGYGWVAAVGSVVLIAVDWALFKHAARAAVFSVILTGLLIYPPTRLAIGYALLPLAWAHDLLT